VIKVTARRRSRVEDCSIKEHRLYAQAFIATAGSNSNHLIRSIEAGAFRFLLQRLGAAVEVSGDPDLVGWHKESLAKLIQHIVRKHHKFVRDEMPRLETLAGKVVARHGAQDPALAEVRDCIAKMNEEMTSHMLKEEQVLFPYIAKMEHELAAGRELPSAFFGSVRNPIVSMLADHDSAGELLKRTRLLTRDYTLPEGACPTFRALFATMQEFEQDMHRHVHLENNILFPRALAMEQATAAALSSHD
jgi:regulator of cell morphogenesis and NO signaling